MTSAYGRKNRLQVTGVSLRAFLLSATLILFLLSSSWAEPLRGSEVEQGISGRAAPHGILAGMSDEQVRGLLLEKLNSELEGKTADPKIGGPGEALNRLLDGLERLSVSTLDGVHQLFSALPQLLPDLYRVFVTL